MVTNLFKKETSNDMPLSEEELQELEDDAIALRLENANKHVLLKEFLKDPYSNLKKYPLYATIFSIPLSLIFFAVGMTFAWGTFYIDDVIIFTVLIMIIPPAFLHQKKRRRITKIEEYIPNFLRDLAEMSRAGLTLPRAVSTVSKSEYGDLSEEVGLMNASMSWGVSFEKALENFAMKINTTLITRIVTLITQANRAGGKVSSVLEAAARDASEMKNLQRERGGNMAVYIVISYMSFFVFVFVILMLATAFVPTIAEAGRAASESGAGSQFIGAFDADGFIRVLFHAAIIQGFVSGLVAGQLGEGEFACGLKHSVFMTLIAWAAFTFAL
ncbi:MAG: type II secretion system F family protein [Candidatus Atribacteria bacterium]|nr:MAG: type II secretion system F family protein [Candidatus Atribacteria bacterium]